MHCQHQSDVQAFPLQGSGGRGVGDAHSADEAEHGLHGGASPSSSISGHSPPCSPPGAASSPACGVKRGRRHCGLHLCSQFQNALHRQATAAAIVCWVEHLCGFGCPAHKIAKQLSASGVLLRQLLSLFKCKWRASGPGGGAGLVGGAAAMRHILAVGCHI